MNWLLLLAPTDRSTDSAMPSPASWVYVCVFFVVRMTVRAMSFGALMSAAFLAYVTSLRIDTMRHWIKVIRVYAGRIAAKVVKIIASRNLRFQKFIRESVSRNDPIAIPKVTISERDFGASPNPARICFVHFWPESLLRSLGWAGESACVWVVSHTVIIIECR